MQQVGEHVVEAGVGGQLRLLVPFAGASPRPLGVFLSIERPTYENEMQRQIEFAIEKRGEGNMEKLLNSGETWTIQ